MNKPNVLLLMCDQFRFDCIASLGNSKIKTPNIDRLVKRGVSFERGYSTCPVCVPARYTVRTGRASHTTGYFSNAKPNDFFGMPENINDRCGDYLATEMRKRGYYAFGIGKFHSYPQFEQMGYDVQMNTEELWGSMEAKYQDAYVGDILRNHPEYSFIEQFHGERTDMYYMPQTSPLPKELTVESWVADRAIEQINSVQNKPYFGFVSFIGPHPPFAPPIPYNRMYCVDDMDNPVKGTLEHDFTDAFLPFMNHAIWADELNDYSARIARARYFGEITYIDSCIGRILDTIEARPDADNTVICFFADHGDFIGDHHSWQKESFFEQSVHVPFLVSYPKELPADVRSDMLVNLTDIFGICTSAAGTPDVRDGIDVLESFKGNQPKREYMYAYYGTPGTSLFKTMVLYKNYKYIFISNGNREQLFDLTQDPNELECLPKDNPLYSQLRRVAYNEATKHVGLKEALNENDFKYFDYKPMETKRIHQFDRATGVTDFTCHIDKKDDVLGDY